ncbi:hypothetical protein CXB51_022640 [Gossypium anomalum]|uniref:Uncharacterized protein n=1 Tax=Gossypium anomalum TaxID=47600 RepID=A0A8J5YKD2_9ROSI|nr:hypothetical protein CXB51_022640 [Gossypium anomalum]
MKKQAIGFSAMVDAQQCDPKQSIKLPLNNINGFNLYRASFACGTFLFDPSIQEEFITWFRSVKRKYDEFETGDRFYVPGFDLYSNPKVQIENECAALRETVCSQQEKIHKKDQSVQSLTCEALAYKHRMMSYGLRRPRLKVTRMERFGIWVWLRTLMRKLIFPNMIIHNSKISFGETPHARDQLRNLEQRIFQVERSSGGSQLDGGCSGTKHVFEKVIVGHSPRRTRHSRRFSIDSYNSFLAKETASEFTIDSPRFNASHKKMEFISRMDEISSSKRMDNASEVGDDTSDRVYTIDPVHNGAVYNETLDSKPGVGIIDEYASTPRGQINLPDACDPDIKKLYTRLQALEADRESMRQALLSMRTDKAQLVLLKEIAQHLSKEMPSNRQDVVAKSSILGSLPFMTVFKAESSPKQVPVWIITKQCWLANAIRQGPSTEAVAMHFKHAGVKSSHVQMKTIIVTVNAQWVDQAIIVNLIIYIRFFFFLLGWDTFCWRISKTGMLASILALWISLFFMASYSSNEVFIVFKIKQCSVHQSWFSCSIYHQNHDLVMYHIYINSIKLVGSTFVFSYP